MEKGIILCVDDEVTILSTLKMQLKESFDETHEIHTAASGEEALELIGVLQEMGRVVEVVISDQIMPGMKGDQLLAKINLTFPETVKILLTGQAGIDDVIRAVNFGGLNYYFGKPWQADELQAKLTEFIAQFRQTIENQRLLAKLDLLADS